MRIHLRIVAGSLRGRKLFCTAAADVRPTPQMVREALFSILGNAVPEQPFIDIFAGTGAMGMEALSRGASTALFVERDPRLVADLERNLRTFDLRDRAQVRRADVYRWAAHWEAPAEPVNIFVSPPFRDLDHRPEALGALLAELQRKAAPGSVLVLQAERDFPASELPGGAWEERRYGRNVLLIWIKPLAA